MGTSSSAIFTGSSQFSNDFVQVVQRAVQFASLPMQQTQNEVATLQSQSTELSTLGSKFSALQSALSNLNNALGIGSYTASATASATGTQIASVALSGTPGVGTYTLEVDGVGSYATAMSNDGTSVTDPAKAGISNGTSFKLWVGTVSTTITPASTTLSALADAINRSSAGVQATVVNVGSTSTPDYRLSLQNGQLAQTTLQLKAVDGTSPGVDLLTPQAPGAAATYRVNGKPAKDLNPLASSSATITLAPGVSATMLSAGTSTITVGRSTSAVSSALQSLATAYNAARNEIANNRGQSKGPLAGQSILSSLSQVLSQIANYSTGTDGISSLTALGLSFDSNFNLSFDGSQFASATTGQISQLSDFLGSTKTGGFLKAANDALQSITDSDDGVIQSAQTSVQHQITRDNQSIADQQQRITDLQNNLNRQMAAADAAISALEQQYSYLHDMFAAMQVNAQNGY